MANTKNIASTVRELLTPTAGSMGYSLWDVEYVREGARRILRLTIDKPDGITIDDCEAFHRAVDPILDEADPIESSYYLEVSSPGIERVLKYDEHFEFCVGQTVELKLYTTDALGRKNIRGVLEGLDGTDIVMQTSQGAEKIARSSVAKAQTVYDFGD